VTAFRSGKAAMTIDGSFRLGALDNQKGLDYGVAELPSRNNVKSNFASYWVNGITTKATGAKLDASVKFLKFITTPEAMELWMNTVGELPARKSVAEKDANKNHAKYGRSSAASLFVCDRLRQRERAAQGAASTWSTRSRSRTCRPRTRSPRPRPKSRSCLTPSTRSRRGGDAAGWPRARSGDAGPAPSAEARASGPGLSRAAGRLLRRHPLLSDGEAFRASFTNWNIVGRMEFIGLANYARLAQDPRSGR
jgi:hypothetical protein